MSTGQVPPVAFRTGAARHRQSLSYQIPWATGKRQSILLNPWGYQAELQISIALSMVITTGTVTDAAAGTSNFFPTISMRSPQGEQLWTTNSRDLFDFNYRLERGVTPATDPSYVAPNYGSTSTQPIQLRLRIPNSLNNGNNFDLGLIQRQIGNNQFTLDLQMANVSDLVGAGTAAATITGTVFVEEVYYDAVRAGQTVNGQPLLPPSFGQYVRLRSTNLGSLITGSNNVKYDTGPVLVDAMHRLINNGASDATIANLTSIEMKANGGNQIDYRTGQRLAYDSALHLGKALRAGVYHEDFCDDTESVNSTKARDMINSAQANQLSFFCLYGGTPSGTSDIQSFYREIVSFAG